MAEIKRKGDAEAYLRDLAARIGKGAVLKVGFLEGATYPDGTPVAMIAAINNYGAPSRGIPPRPFFSGMVDEKSPEWGDTFAGLMEANGDDTVKALRLMGEGIKGQLQQSIRDTVAPPNAPSTIRAKGFDKPLIDIGHMLNSVDYEVTERAP